MGNIAMCIYFKYIQYRVFPSAKQLSIIAMYFVIFGKYLVITLLFLITT